MIRNKIGLIPRYNWDYGLSELSRSLLRLSSTEGECSEIFRKIFGSEPIFTNAGRTSLYAILKSLDLPQGAEVGVPLYCCPVVFDTIKQAGLTPRFVDVNLEDYCLSPADLKDKISSLKAIVLVHMFGHPADMEPILATCDGIPVIEDCAQSLFSKYKGTYTGFLSGYSFFSFRSGKYISAGEGSALFLKDPAKIESVKRIANSFEQRGFLGDVVHSAATYIKSTFYKRPWYGTIGSPLGKRMDRKLNLTAKAGFTPGGIGKSDLAVIGHRIGSFLSKVVKQRENSEYLLKNIGRGNLILPSERPECWSNYSQFAIRLGSEQKRDQLAAYLFDHGVDSAKYGDEVLDVVKQEYHYSGDCPNSEQASKTILVIPNYYTLSQKDLDHVVACVNSGSKLL